MPTDAELRAAKLINDINAEVMRNQWPDAPTLGESLDYHRYRCAVKVIAEALEEWRHHGD